MNSCVYVCMSEDLYPAHLKRSETNKNVFNARLKRSVDRSTERKEVGRLYNMRVTQWKTA